MSSQRFEQKVQDIRERAGITVGISCPELADLRKGVSIFKVDDELADIICDTPRQHAAIAWNVRGAVEWCKAYGIPYRVHT